MPDPERLKELLRQREQLEREIASASGQAPAPAAKPPGTKPPLPTTTRSSDSRSTDPDVLFDRYTKANEQTKPFSKQGCWIVFSTVMVIIVGAVVVLYVVRYRH